MSAPKCVNCKTKMKKVSGMSKVFKRKYVVSDITSCVCQKCGEEYLTPKEYEMIRKNRLY